MYSVKQLPVVLYKTMNEYLFINYMVVSFSIINDYTPYVVLSCTRQKRKDHGRKGKDTMIARFNSDRG